jgi:hypothetical protein
MERLCKILNGQLIMPDWYNAISALCGVIIGALWFMHCLETMGFPDKKRSWIKFCLMWGVGVVVGATLFNLVIFLLFAR